MSFKDKLDKELERRNLNPQDSVSDSDSGSAQKNKIFSFKYFFLGLILSLLVTASFVAYAALNTDKTQIDLQGRLSSKAALVEREVILPTMVVQPVVTMLPNETQPPTQDPIPSLPDQNTEVETQPANLTDLIPDLYESTAAGLKPQRREKDGLTVFEAYKAPFDASNKPKISFIIMELGISKDKTNEIIADMPEGVSLAFSPYAQNLNNLLRDARRDNHEAWMVLPLETKNYPMDDPGPLTLLKEASTAQNKDRLGKILTSATGYVGFIPDRNHIYTPQTVRTSPVINEILQRGLAVVESRLGANNFIKELAIQRNAPYGQVDFWIDPEKSEADIKNELSNILSFAQARGEAMVMLYPYPSSIKAVKDFIAVHQNDIQLTPASALVGYDG